MIIGFDIDGVLYPWHEEVYDLFQRRYGYEGSYRKFWAEYIPTIQGTILLDNTIADPTLYSTRSIKAKYLRALWQIADLGHEIWYVSSLHKEARRERVKWYSSNSLPYPKNYTFVDGVYKLNAVLSLGCGYFVEDRVPTIKDLLGHVFVFIIDQPWNGELEDSDGLLRIQSVADLPDLLWRNDVYR